MKTKKIKNEIMMQLFKLRSVPFASCLVLAFICIASASEASSIKNSEFYMKEFDEMLIKNSLKESFNQILFSSEEKGIVVFSVNNDIQWTFPLKEKDISSNARMSMIGLSQGFNGCYYRNLFISTFDTKDYNWTSPSEIEIDPTITRESAEQEIFFSREIKGRFEIFCCYLKEGMCSPAFKLGRTVNTYRNAVNPVLSDDGNTLYFASDRLGGKGGFDIYASDRNPDGSWGLSYNLGNSVNTISDEVNPIILDDNATLLFLRKDYSSFVRIQSTLFVVTARDDGFWSLPEKLADNLKNEAECVLYASYVYGEK